MPPLAAAYGIGDPGCDRRAAAEEIVMMLPALRSFMPGRKVLIVRNVAVRLPSRDARHSSSVVCSSGPGLVKLPPALATRISIGPSSSSIWQRMASMSLNLVVSAMTCVARPPACSISPRTTDSAAASLPWTATLAHCRANSLAMAAPIPRELPVTNAILSFNRSMHILLFSNRYAAIGRIMRRTSRRQPCAYGDNQTPDEHGHDRKVVRDVGQRARTDTDNDCEYADQGAPKGERLSGEADPSRPSSAERGHRQP